MKARLLADGATVEIFEGGYSDRFPLARLPQRVAFYRSLRDREPSGDMKGRSYPWREIYGPTVEALEKVAKVARVMNGG